MDVRNPKTTTSAYLYPTFIPVSNFLILFFPPFIQSGALQTARLFPTSPSFA